MPSHTPSSSPPSKTHTKNTLQVFGGQLWSVLLQQYKTPIMQIHGNIWAVDSSKSIYLSNSQIHHQVNTAWDQQVKKIVIMADSSFKAPFFNTLNSLHCTNNLTKKHLQFTFHGIPHSFADAYHACSSSGVQYEQHWAKNISDCRGLICTLHCKQVPVSGTGPSGHRRLEAVSSAQSLPMTCQSASWRQG